MATQTASAAVTRSNIKNSLENDSKSGNQAPTYFQPFLPQDALQSLVQEERVKSTLRKWFPGSNSTKGAYMSATPDLRTSVETLTEYVMKGGGKVFLTLSYIQAGHRIESLRAAGFKDEDLPIGVTLEDRAFRLLPDGSLDQTQTNELPCFTAWDNDKQLEDFAQDQWIFLAPVFTESQFDYEFESSRRLPFISSRNPEPSMGRFGAIRKARLHVEHQRLDDVYKRFRGKDRHIEIALKELIQDAYIVTDVNKFYPREMKTLKTMRDLKHPHLIRAIAAFKRGTDRCFVFPWADEGNINDFWQNHSQSILHPGIMFWAIGQMKGISEGIQKLHETNTRHGDIKPGNILCFGSNDDDSGQRTLVIADVGLAKVHEDYTRYRFFGTSTRYGTLMYDPPETASYQDGVVVSRLYDIWGLGCVFLEFAIWLVQGWDGLQRFRQSLKEVENNSRFWLPTGKRNPAVENWINNEFQSSTMHPALQDLVDLISQKLLVSERNGRIGAIILVRELEDIQAKASNSSRTSKVEVVSPARQTIEAEDPAGEPTTSLPKQDTLDQWGNQDGNHFVNKDTSSFVGTHLPLSPDEPLIESKVGVRKQEATIYPLSDSGYETATIPASTFAQKADQIPEEPGDDDTGTVYSYAGSLNDLTIEGYVSELGYDLFQQVMTALNSNDRLENACKALPGLIKAMALKLGHGEVSQEHRDAMSFIHKNHEITRSFRQAYFQSSRWAEPVWIDMMSRSLEEADILPEDSISNVFHVNLTCEDQDRMSEDQDRASEDTKFESQDQNAQLKILHLRKYRELVSNSFGYEWLLRSLEREIMLERAPVDAMQNIRHQILDAIPGSHRISRHRPPRVYTVVYYVGWDIVRFLAEQEYTETDDEALGKAITLTGSVRSAQAMSCQEYLAQTWPLTGPSLLQLIQDLVRKRDDDDVVVVSLSLVGSRLKVESSGIPDFVAEVGEQLAWLGAALPSTRRGDGLFYCSPVIDIDKPRINSNTGGPESLQCSITFQIRDCQQTSSDANGQCWLAMFGQVVIAQGFPIPRRPQAGTGLEIPLDMMAALVGTQHINVFNAKVFIKGFSAMLVPTKMVDDVVIWHLLYTPKWNDRISYLDCSVEHLGCTVEELKPARHVIGWCPEAVCTAGVSTAGYYVKRSGLGSPRSGFALEHLEVQAGQYVLVTASFSVGRKQKSIAFQQRGYPNMMRQLSQRFFVLWDETDKRGWLVDGASTLLHLVQASLEHSKSAFGESIMLSPNKKIKIKESALKTLVDLENREMPLYIDGLGIAEEPTEHRGGPSGTNTQPSLPTTQRTYYLLQHQIEDIYQVLEKLIDHQKTAKEQDGVAIRIESRQWLEGWDFKDLATLQFTISPRVADLKAAEDEWLRLIRSIGAITLFGRGFGELIKPEGPHCSRWTSLPTEKYYLAVCVKDLLEIIEQNNGDLETNPIKITKDTLWHIKQGVFPQCGCLGGDTANHHGDLVQRLSCPGFMRQTNNNLRVDLKDKGAVIFGHSLNHSQDGPDEGGAVEGVPPAEARDGGFKSSISREMHRLFRSGSSTSGTPYSTQLDASVSPVTDTSQTESVHSRGLRQRFMEKVFQKILPSEESIKKMTGS
ncbi:hypothetical protein FDECE_14918 [Fusarium decemcellulare]|nr:hypothetical protein FDECE_14918 [Fusarium decemcellulare]